MQDKVTCRTPTSGKSGTTAIPAWKYAIIRQAILDALDVSEAGWVRFADLPAIVEAQLSTNQLAKLGSVGWHVTTVKLNMEVEGEILRVSGSGPQRLILA